MRLVKSTNLKIVFIMAAALSKGEDYYKQALEHNKYHLPSLLRLAGIFESLQVLHMMKLSTA